MPIDPADVATCVSDSPPAPDGGPIPAAPPIVQTSLFQFPSLASIREGLGREHRTTVYTRGTNPTVRAVEEKIARLERGEACLAFASGMAAVSAVLTGLLQAGDHVLVVNRIYGPTLQLLRHLERFGVTHDRAAGPGPDDVRAALRPSTRLVWMESPGTMTFDVLDVAAVADVAREHGALTCLDNSWATPLLQKPITLGVDVVVHSATKYLAGHSDVVAGVVVSTEERMETVFRRSLLLGGGILAPFDAWLLGRGLRTLPVRLRQHGEDGLAVARHLRDHAAVRRVHHPAFDPRPDLVERQLAGFSGLLSFELERDDYASVEAVVDRLEHFRVGVSWGGVESLVLAHQGPGGDPPGGLPRGLVRISVGLEGAGLLVEDLDRALAAVA